MGAKRLTLRVLLVASLVSGLGRTWALSGASPNWNALLTSYRANLGSSSGLGHIDRSLLGGGGDFETTSRKLASDLGISNQAAVGLLHARLLRDDSEFHPTADQFRRSAEGLLRVAWEDPELAAVYVELQQLMRRLPDGTVAGWIREEIMTVVRESPNPGRVALAVARGFPGDPISTKVLAQAIKLRPDDLDSLDGLAISGPAPLSPTLQATLHNETFSGSEKDAARLERARELAVDLFNAGLTGRLVRLLHSLPRPLLGQLEGSDLPTPPGLGFSSRFISTREDFRLSLVAAYWVERDYRAAQRLWSRLEAPPETDGEGDSKKDRSAQRRRLRYLLLASVLEPRSADVFSTLVELIQPGEDRAPYSADPLSTIPWRVVLGRFAVGEGYPGLASASLEKAASQLSDDYPIRFANQDLLDFAGVSRLKPAYQRLVDERLALAARLRQEGRETGATDSLVAVPGRSSGRTALGEVLGGVEAVPFEYPPAKTDPMVVDESLENLKYKWGVPRGFSLIALAERDGTVFALGVSQAYDPTGGGAGGGYWILQSADGGDSWSAPIYTGLPVGQPYRVPRLAKAEVLGTGDLRVQATTEICWPRAFSFESGAAVRPKSVSLIFRMEELVRDGDQDGLTDIAEWRLRLDPGRADTDGDGIDDLSDLLPQIPDRGEPGPDGGPLPALFARIVGTPEPDDLLERVVFVAASQSGVVGAAGRWRVVFLPDEELVANYPACGLPARVTLLLFERGGSGQFVVWSGRRRGGSWITRRRKDGSFLVTGSDWSTCG